LRKVEPTAGGAPSGRYSALVELNWENAARLSLIWLANVWSTTKPRSAISMAGRSASRREIVPHFCSAVCQVCGVPGTPTEMPLMRASWNCNGSPVAGSTNASTFMLAGAASRPSMVCTVLVRAL
jgi:hypothetical protein